MMMMMVRMLSPLVFPASRSSMTRLMQPKELLALECIILAQFCEPISFFFFSSIPKKKIRNQNSINCHGRDTQNPPDIIVPDEKSA
jgi:hypothetical protein